MGGNDLTKKIFNMDSEDSTKIFKKQKDDLKKLAAKLYPKVAENICRFIEDPDEKEKHLNDLRQLSLEHAKLDIEIKVQEDALDHTTKKLKEVKDLIIEQQYNYALEGYRDGRKKSDEEIEEDDNNCKELDKVIKKSLMKTE